jgi:hypothetical protein
MAPSRTDTNGNGEFLGSFTAASEVKITGFEAHGKISILKPTTYKKFKLETH